MTSMSLRSKDVKVSCWNEFWRCIAFFKTFGCVIEWRGKIVSQKLSKYTE